MDTQAAARSAIKVAAVQASPVFLDRQATVDKACELIAEAGREGARLVVFPEAFVPAYPDWVWVVPPGQKALLNGLYAELLDNAVTVPGPETERLGAAARKAQAHVAIGVSERNAEASGASLYNTLVYLGPDGRFLGKHRKLVPTGGERLVWAQGDGSTLEVYDTPLGRLGGLICWENYMPLARYTVYAAGVQIYLAPTWDNGEIWLASLKHMAREGGMYVIGCSIAMTLDDIPARYEFRQLYREGKDWINAGDTAIVDPRGRFLAGPLHKDKGILYAELDLAEIPASKWMLDVAGHYARPDVFRLEVNRERQDLVR